MNLYIPWYLPWCHLVCDIREHFLFPGNMAHFHVVFMKSLFFECLLNFLAVNHEQFPMQITHKSKPDNNTWFTKWMEILAAEDFHRNSSPCQLEIQRKQQKNRRQETCRAERASQCHHQETKETLQQPKTCTEASTKYDMQLPCKQNWWRGNTDCFKKMPLTEFSTKVIRRGN